ncbi:HNH endonuclease [Pseudoduganella sp. OTU4001]|uniref:HNH endonuclease n=1 Tax=Pseudoduganella sp. OTU4001 TaxID=3043854 RepID=UPI00313EAEDB
MKLQTLKPRIKEIKATRSPALVQTGTKRLEGRARVDRNKKWKDAHPLCVVCEAAGRTRPVDEVDHKVPLWAGGPDDESNLQSLCTPCHELKTTREAAMRAAGGFIPD